LYIFVYVFQLQVAATPCNATCRSGSIDSGSQIAASGFEQDVGVVICQTTIASDWIACSELFQQLHSSIVYIILVFTCNACQQRQTHLCESCPQNFPQASSIPTRTSF
jgi:hypothetical protein